MKRKGEWEMIQKMTLFATKKPKTMSLLAVILLVAATTLFFPSSTSAVSAAKGPWGQADTITGKITEIDASHPTKSLTLQSSELGLSAPNNEINIFVNDKTAVRMCYAGKSSLKDLKAGAKLQVTFHEIAGLAVADFIYKPC
jgi:hypothetical protein